MIKRNWPYIYPPLVALMDIIVFNIAFLSAIYLKYYDLSMISVCLPKWLFLNIVFIPIAFFVGIYRGIFQISLESQDSNLKKFTFYLGLVTMSYLFLVKTQYDTRGVILIFLIVQYFFLSMNHFLLNTFNRFLIRRGFGRKNTIIVGSDMSAHHFNEHLNDIFGDYYNVKGYISNGSVVIDSFLKENMIGKYNEIDSIIKEYNIKLCIIDALPEQFFVKKLKVKCKNVYSCFFSKTTKTEPINHISRTINVERTSSLDDVKEHILYKTMVFPANAKEVPGFCAHLTAPTRAYDRDMNGGEGGYRWLCSKPDHYFLSLCY